MLKRLLRSVLPRTQYREVANQEDFDFVINRCLAEAKDGHFSSLYTSKNQNIKKGLMHQIACSVNDLPYPFEPGNPRQGTGAKLLIIEKKLKRLGFVLLLEHMPGSWNHKIEIHLVSLVPEHRNIGLGKQLIKDILRLTPAKEIYARCYVNSTTMIHLLNRFGFKTTKTSDQGTQTLTLNR